MPKYVESIVTRIPVRDADRMPATERCSSQAVASRPLVPVFQIPGLAPDERVAELRLRVSSGLYSTPIVVEQVARQMVLDASMAG